MKVGRQSWKFENNVYLQETERQLTIRVTGTIKRYFDILYDEPYCGQKSWEQAEWTQMTEKCYSKSY